MRSASSKSPSIGSVSRTPAEVLRVTLLHGDEILDVPDVLVVASMIAANRACACCACLRSEMSRWTPQNE